MLMRMTFTVLTVRVPADLKERISDDARKRGMKPAQYARFLLEGGTFLEDEAQVRDLVEDLDRRLSRLEEMAHGV
jgi:hypothetical protein